MDITKSLDSARHIKSNLDHVDTFKPLRTVYSIIRRRVDEAFISRNRMSCVFVCME